MSEAYPVIRAFFPLVECQGEYWGFMFDGSNFNFTKLIRYNKSTNEHFSILLINNSASIVNSTTFKRTPTGCLSYSVRDILRTNVLRSIIIALEDCCKMIPMSDKMTPDVTLNISLTGLFYSFESNGSHYLIDSKGRCFSQENVAVAIKNVPFIIVGQADGLIATLEKRYAVCDCYAKKFFDCFRKDKGESLQYPVVKVRSVKEFVNQNACLKSYLDPDYFAIPKREAAVPQKDLIVQPIDPTHVQPQSLSGFLTSEDENFAGPQNRPGESTYVQVEDLADEFDFTKIELQDESSYPEFQEQYKISRLYQPLEIKKPQQPVSSINLFPSSNNNNSMVNPANALVKPTTTNLKDFVPYNPKKVDFYPPSYASIAPVNALVSNLNPQSTNYVNSSGLNTYSPLDTVVPVKNPLVKDYGSQEVATKNFRTIQLPVHTINDLTLTVTISAFLDSDAAAPVEFDFSKSMKMSQIVDFLKILTQFVGSEALKRVDFTNIIKTRSSDTLLEIRQELDRLEHTCKFKIKFDETSFPIISSSVESDYSRKFEKAEESLRIKWITDELVSFVPKWPAPLAVESFITLMKQKYGKSVRADHIFNAVYALSGKLYINQEGFFVLSAYYNPLDNKS